VAVKQPAFQQGDSPPVPASGRDMLASRTRDSVGFEMSVETLLEKASKNFPGAPEALPDFRRAEATKSFLN
jgi:hypothetical protein